MSQGEMWHLDFRTGEARQISEEEHRQMVAEMMARTKVKNGIAYIDCDPPEDEEE